jgi:DNA-directed RNA polymerase specialized sigma24 family protein
VSALILTLTGERAGEREPLAPAYSVIAPPRDRVELRTDDHPVQAAEVDVVALDGAMTHLANFDPDLCRIIEMRFFGGLSIEESAAAMGVSPATVKREWIAAKAWLSRELGEDA